MTAQVDIVNLAFSAIGTRSTIANFQEQTPEGSQARLQWAPALDAVLQAAHWNFARKQAALTLMRDATLNPPDPVPMPWQYEYAYPADCIQARYVMPQIDNVPGYPGSTIALGPPVRFLISSDLDQNGAVAKVILTNQVNATLVYTSRVTNVAMYDGQFVDALANYLGARMCMALTGSRERMKEAFALADSVCRAAQASNGNEGLTVFDNVPDWIRARGYVADWASWAGSPFVVGPQNLTMIS